MPPELAIIGAGVMAEAIARGILRSGAIAPDRIIAADISPERREFFHSQLKIRAVEDPAAAVAGAATILLCIKPYQMQSVLKTLSASVEPTSLFISIAAGTSTTLIENTLGQDKPWRVIRAMPNTPALVGEGMVAYAPGKNATPRDLETAKKIFASGAKVLQLTEDKMDAVTAISGSGPAYVFFLVEQMIRAGTELGLEPLEARTLAIQTAVGAAKMMSQSTDNPADHRRRVTTPNGTTHAAISAMESHDWPNITTDAIKAAAKRSREMGQ